MNKIANYLKNYLVNYFKGVNWYQLGFAVTAITLLSVESSYAQSFTGMSTFFTAILTAMTGPIGIALSGLAVCGVGFLFLLGRMDWAYAIAIVVGIGVIFGAASFTSALVAT